LQSAATPWSWQIYSSKAIVTLYDTNAEQNDNRQHRVVNAKLAYMFEESHPEKICKVNSDENLYWLVNPILKSPANTTKKTCCDSGQQ